MGGLFDSGVHTLHLVGVSDASLLTHDSAFSFSLPSVVNKGHYLQVFPVLRLDPCVYISYYFCNNIRKETRVRMQMMSGPRLLADSKK